jgi:hypothetical protein
MMTTTIPRAAALFTLIALIGACSYNPGRPENFARIDNFTITFVGTNNLGTPEKPVTFSTDYNTPDVFTIDIEAIKNGQLDKSFNDWVAVTIPHSCARIASPDPPAIQLKNGAARGVQIKVYNAYGPYRIVVTDEGFVPKPGGGAACGNGIDDDNDGYIDQDDLGCYRGPGGKQKAFWAWDNTESGGNDASGASEVINARRPLIEDIQKPILGVSGDESPLLECMADVDRGWLLVTRVGVDGLYVTDFSDPDIKWDSAKNNWSFKPEDLSYDSLFIYNYSTPLNLQAGDCLTQLDGTVFEFYGYTELNKPNWKKGDFGFCGVKGRLAGITECPSKETDGSCCDQGCVDRLRKDGIDDDAVEAQCCQGKCPAKYRCENFMCRPDPEHKDHLACRKKIEQLVNSPPDITALMYSDPGGLASIWSRPNQAEPFESGIVKLSNVAVFSEARRCDVDGNNQLDFSVKEEKDCSNQCGTDVKCMVRENFTRYNQWSVNFTDGDNVAKEVQVVTAGSIQEFDPIKASDAAKAAGTPMILKSVVGTMRHLIFGRPQWTIEARWPADCTDCTNK